MVNIQLISTGPVCAAKKIQKSSIPLLTGAIGLRITRSIDGGNVAGERALRSKFRKTGRLGLDRKVRLLGGF